MTRNDRPRFLVHLYSMLAALVAALALFAGCGGPLDVDERGSGLEPKAGAPDPFIGTFAGKVTGAASSTAAISVTSTADKATPGALDAAVHIGSGLTADAGLCGQHAVPALDKSITFVHTTASQVTGKTTWPLMGADLDVTFTGQIAADGKTMNATVSVEIPIAFCSQVQMTAELTRQPAASAPGHH